MWFSSVTGLVYSLILSAEPSHSSTSSASLIIFSLFDDAVLQVGGDWLKILVSVFIFLVISNPIYSCVSSFEKLTSLSFFMADS